MNQEVFAALAEALERGEEVALVTIVAAHGSTPQRVGAKMLVYPDGRTVGTIGGGCYENDAFWKAREAITNRRPLSVKYELNDDFAQETGLVCGGQMEVFIEPVEASPDVYIFGAGHVVDHIPTWLQTHQLPPTAYAVIVTRGHTHDLDALRAVVSQSMRYVGLIGS